MSCYKLACSLKVLLIYTAILLFFGCATYYDKNQKFQQKFVQGDIDGANNILNKNKKGETDKNKLLYFLQKGVVMQMLQNYEESNSYFEKAYIFTEDFRKNYTKEALSIITNPAIKPYEGEDFEVVLIHYFKALNYVMTGDFDAALVECRRLDIKINSLNDRYENHKNRYKKDAFVLNLTGIIYEAAGDINNAFIAYRNAYEAYKDIYAPFFNSSPPEQLKQDLLRTAYLNGFYDELAHYEKLFETKYVHNQNNGGELIFFWHNGLGPVKYEWSINFFIVKGQGGVVSFVNEDLGLTFPFPLPQSETQSSFPGDLKFVRVAFPKYLERKPYYRAAYIINKDVKYDLEAVENINEIAIKTLEDRMLRELGSGLLRLAVKQSAEYQIRKQDQNIGALVSMLNAVSEKADTRNWQTLPYSISYSRMYIDEGENKIELKCVSADKSREETYNYIVEGKKGQTVFKTFHTLESLPLGY